MALKKCKKCGHQVSTKAATCPNCGTRMSKRLKKVMWIVGGTVGALVLIPLVIGIVLAVVSPSPSAPSRESSPSASVLYKRVQANMASGKWQSALVVSRTLIKDYPNSKEADAVKATVPVLNKRIAREKVEAERKERVREKAKIKAKIDPDAFDVESGDPPGTLAKLKRAAALAAQGANCAKVTMATYLPADQQYPEHKGQPYYVTCNAKHGPVQGFAYGVYFNEADLKAGRVKNQTQPIAKDQAISLCERAIKAQLQYPSSFDLKMFSGGGVSDNGTTNREVDLPFTALNGLGNRIPQLGKCIVEPNGHTDVTILNR